VVAELAALPKTEAAVKAVVRIPAAGA